MSDLLRFEIWQVFLLENLCDVRLWKHRWVKIGVGLPNCSWDQVVTGAGVLLSCVLGLCYTKDINFIFFSPEIFSSSIFTSTSNGVSYFALINRFEGLKMRCSWDIRDSLLWAICQDLKFGNFFLLENLCDVCSRKHRFVKIGRRLKNCSWSQVVTGVWILLSCVLGLHWTKDTDFIFFFPLKFSVLLFSHRRVMGSHILHSSIALEG